MLQSMGSQRIGHDLGTEQQQLNHQSNLARKLSQRPSHLEKILLLRYPSKDIQILHFTPHHLFFLNFILFLNFTILYWFCHISK